MLDLVFPPEECDDRFGLAFQRGGHGAVHELKVELGLLPKSPYDRQDVPDLAVVQAAYAEMYGQAG